MPFFLSTSDPGALQPKQGFVVHKSYLHLTVSLV
jgi:hypothetical protein